jgi:hypothetical protein
LPRTKEEVTAEDSARPLAAAAEDEMYIKDHSIYQGSMNTIPSDEALLQDIYDKYLIAGKNAQNECGATLMLRDIPYRLQVEPDLLNLLRQTCEMDHVDYIYLPRTLEGFCPNQNRQTNKGYCFIHFSVAASAEAFASRMHDHVLSSVSGGKRLIFSMAKFQGLRTNLMNVLDIHAKKWRPKNGFAHIRNSKGDMVCVGLMPLRNLVKRRSMRVFSVESRRFFNRRLTN